MLKKKILVVILGLLVFGQTIAQTAPTPTPEKKEISAKTADKAIALLNNLAGEAEQFSVPENRIVARIEVAELLWERDEKQARVMYQSAVNDLNNLLLAIPPQDEEASDQETTARYLTIYTLRELRNKILLSLAPRDPALTLESIQTLKNKFTDSDDYSAENKALELTLASQIAKKDPKQAYEVAKENLENGISYNLFTSLEELYKIDGEFGAKLAKDIYAKITSVGTKITTPYDAASNTNTAATTQPDSSTIGVWDVQQFYTTVKKLNRLAEKDKKSPLLGESEIKEIVDLLAKKYATQQYLSAYEIAPIMPDLSKYYPAQAQVLRKKIGQDNSAELTNMVSAQVLENEIEGKSAEEILKIIDKKPAEERDNLYWKAAEKAFNDGDTEKAKEFYTKIKTKREYDYLDDRIKADLPLTLAKKGDLAQVREAIAKMKTPEERIEILTRTAETLAKNGDKKTAAALTEEARALFVGKMKQRKNLDTLLNLSHAYAAFDPEQGFALLEANMPFFNDLVNAAVMLSEFNDTGAVQDEELLLRSAADESFRYIADGVVLVQDFAEADFERTIGLTEKFSRPEIRFIARLRAAQALLDKDAIKKEEERQTKLNEEYGDH